MIARIARVIGTARHVELMLACKDKRRADILTVNVGMIAFDAAETVTVKLGQEPRLIVRMRKNGHAARGTDHTDHFLGTIGNKGRRDARLRPTEGRNPVPVVRLTESHVLHECRKNMLVTKPSILRREVKHIVPGDAEGIAVFLHHAKLRLGRAVRRIACIAKILRHQRRRRITVVAENMKAYTQFARIGLNTHHKIQPLDSGRRLHRFTPRHRFVVGHRYGGIAHLLYHRAKLGGRIDPVRIGRMQVQVRKLLGLL